MADQVIGFEITAELSAFRAELAKIPDIGEKEAKALASQFQRQLKATEKAAKDLRRATKDAADATKDFSDKAGKAGSTAGKFAQALGIISPEAQHALMGIADLADGAEGLGAISAATGATVGTLGAALVALAAAVAPVVGQLVVMQREENEAAARAEFLTRHIHDMDAASRGLEDALLAAAVATGRLSEAQGEIAAIGDKAARAVLDFQKAQEEERRTANESYFAAERRLTQLDALPGFLKTAADYYGGYTSAQHEALWTLRELDKQEAKNQDVVAETTVAQKEAAAAERKKKDERDRATESTRAAERHERELADALREVSDALAAEGALAERNLATWDRATDATAALIDEQHRALATDEERIELDREAARATADRLLQERLAVSSALSAEETAYAEHKAALSAIDERYDEEQARRRERNTAASETAAVDSTEMYGQAVQLAGQLLDDLTAQAGDAYSAAADTVTRMTEYQAAAEGHLTEAQQAELNRRIEAQKDAARAAFDAQKALALAGAIVNTAQGVTQALASAPPPLSFVNAALVGAAGAVEIGTIVGQQPSFHKGGALDLQPDEMAITARRREFVLNPTGRGVMGDDELHKANAGVPSGGGQVVAVSVYRHTRQVDRWKTDGLLQGDPIAAAITKGQLVGHWSGTR